MCTRQPRRAGTVFPGIAALIVALWACHCCPDFAKAQNAAVAIEAKKDAADEKTIRALIAQLGDPSFDVREAAGKRLASIGEPAFDQLENSALRSTDPEVRYSAGLLVQRISKGLFSQVRYFEGRHAGKQTWVSRVVVTRDGRRAVSAGKDALRSWDLASGKEVGFIDSKGIESWALAISADQGNRGQT